MLGISARGGGVALARQEPARFHASRIQITILHLEQGGPAYGPRDGTRKSWRPLRVPALESMSRREMSAPSSIMQMAGVDLRELELEKDERVRIP